MKHKTALLIGCWIVGLVSVFATAAEIPKNIQLKDLDGKSVLLRDVTKDKIAVLVFWASWCVPCKKELPEMGKFHEEFKDKGVLVVGISTDTTRDMSKVKPYVTTHKLPYPTLLDTEATLGKLVNPRGALPYTLVMDRAGSVVFEFQGYRSGDLDKIKAKVTELVEKPPATPTEPTPASGN